MTKLTRKELAEIISKIRDDVVTVTQVRKNEAKWGLKAARGKDLNKRVVRYDRAKALLALIIAGVLPAGSGASARSKS